ncbi:hypothetical protein CVT25_003094 [Psilocybe cyanescens]|uniref:non-specific serine/threonine protein kinase n=1 Tax=Psilocybe cyanescens TaxID=93625 RepID=A0A409X620_PSICY|nr:hypothetical protein CVT25_003094 [Psilocybe cyanescens]
MLAETLCGSPLYMAPEILRYEKYDARADLWSVGAVLYEMAVGRAPFRAQNHIELLKRIEHSKGVRFPDEEAERGDGDREKGKDREREREREKKGSVGGSADLPVPEDIKALIRKLLQRTPAARASYEEFFGSRAMVRSKFPRPQDSGSLGGGGGAGPAQGGQAQAHVGAPWMGGRPPTPEHHRVIPPEVLDMNVMIPPSKFNFRRVDADAGAGAAGGHAEGAGAGTGVSPRGAGPSASARDGSPGAGAGKGKRRSGYGTGVGFSPRGAGTGTGGQGGGGQGQGQGLSTEGSFIPGETEEDGNLRREYVLVGDTRAVEFNRAVDEISSAQPRRPLHDRRAQTFERDYNNTNASPGYPAVTLLSPTTTTSPITTTATSPNAMTFPPAPHSAGAAVPPPLSSSPSRAATNALNRALSIASKKLFGHGHSHSHSGGGGAGDKNGKHRASPSRDFAEGGGGGGGGYFGGGGPGSAQSSPRRVQGVPLPGDEGDRGTAAGERDPMEEELLAALEELAQKTDVLTRWADQMYEYVKAIPQSAFLFFSYFSPSFPPSQRFCDPEPLPDPTKFAQREGEPDKHARRRKHADMEAEFNAVTCVAVYMLLMSFSQKGIDKLRNFQEHMKMRHPEGDFVVSEGFDEALNWFREHFIKCNDRADLVKTWLPVTYDGPKSYLDQLVYDRALILSRTAARKELLDQMTTPDECEKLYEESLWCLYALQDNLLQSGNPFMDEDRETIATWIKRTKLRLVRCRARMAMNHHDRVNDARADHNLADVARIPAPWDAKPTTGSPLHVNTTLS